MPFLYGMFIQNLDFISSILIILNSLYFKNYKYIFIYHNINGILHINLYYILILLNSRESVYERLKSFDLLQP